MRTLDNQVVLPEFQKLLSERNLVPAKQIPFFALWARRFLSYSKGMEAMPLGLRLDRFLKHTSLQENAQEWQLEQAERAVRLYAVHFGGEAPAGEGPPPAGGYEDCAARLKEALRLRHYAYTTERSYLDWFRRFHDYVHAVKKQEGGYTAEDVRDFLSRLALVDRVSASTQNQAFSALLFFFRDVLGVGLGDMDKTVRAKRGVRVPTVLTVEETKSLLAAMSGETLLLAQLLYGGGLRLMEALRLRVQDIDFGSHSVVVRGGKGDKDRRTILPRTVVECLRAHLVKVKVLHEKDLSLGHGEVYLPDALERKYPGAGRDWVWQYVFPARGLSVDPRSGKVRRHHLSAKAIQTAVSLAARRAGLAKHATVHTLRHSFATHLLIKGVNIREIQELLGHKHVETTMVYTHVLRGLNRAPVSPLDEMESVKG
jgi:integron integrase